MRTQRPPAIVFGKRGYDPSTETFHTQHDWDGPDSLSYEVTRAIAVSTGAAITTVPPLAESIDCDALARLFTDLDRSCRPQDRVVFAHYGCEIAVYRNGHIAIRRRDCEP